MPSIFGMTVENTGSVSLSCDGDRRAAYLLLDNAIPTIRRVEYAIDKELKARSVCGLPHAAWTAKMLATASPQMPLRLLVPHRINHPAAHN